MADHDIPPTGAVDRLAELVQAADGDRRARRLVINRASRALAADAESERRAKSAVAEAEQRAKAIEAQAEARIRAAEARVRVNERERDADRAERQARRAESAAVREAKAEAAALRRARWAARRDMCSAAAPAALSMVVYIAAVASAVFGQVSVATGRYNWAPWRALLLAGFIELMALAMALTANRLRLRGERALAPRVLTWVFAGFAATVNVWGHMADPLMATGLGAASLGGITLWEIRSSARHRDALRAAGQLAHPLPPLGARFWALHPRIAVTAYRLGVRQQLSASAAPLVAAAEAKRKGLPVELPAAPLQVTARAQVPVHPVPPMPQPTAIEPRDSEQAAIGAGAPNGDGGTSGGPAGAPAVAAGAPACDAAERTEEQPAPAALPIGIGLPALVGATGEFRALTAPEHYHRDGYANGQRMPVLSRQRAAIAESAAVAEPVTTPVATGELVGAKRGGVPSEAREWIAEQLAAERTPTGPEVGRRYQVDASTGRRWIRQIRSDLG